MEFPISRERLLNYRSNEALAVETKQRVQNEIYRICKEVENIVLTTNERKCIYTIQDHVKYPMLRTSSQVNLPQPTSIVKDLLVAIQNTFPDSTVVTDPLETYILIDWS